jgi:hypothetical protein
MTLAVAGTMFHPGAFTLDDVRIYAIDALDREVLLHDDFNTRDSTAPWRNSLLPKDETLRTVTLGGLSHDSTHQRMRIDLLPDEMNASEDDPSVMGLAARQYCSLQEGREYLVSFKVDTTGSQRPDRLQLILFTGERMASGIPIPSDVIDLYDSEDFEWSDSLQALSRRPPPSCT